jgi:hypothetical protein
MCFIYYLILQKINDWLLTVYASLNLSCTGLPKMFCPGGTVPIANDINIEFYTKWKLVENGI